MAERHKSSIKRSRQAAKRRHANRIKREQIKTVVKKVQNAKTVEEYRQSFTTATKTLSRMAAKGIMHKNTAARRKSRLAKLSAKFAAPAAEPSAS